MAVLNAKKHQLDSPKHESIGLIRRAESASAFPQCPARADRSILAIRLSNRDDGSVASLSLSDAQLGPVL